MASQQGQTAVQFLDEQQQLTTLTHRPALPTIPEDRPVVRDRPSAREIQARRVFRERLHRVSVVLGVIILYLIFATQAIIATFTGNCTSLCWVILLVASVTTAVFNELRMDNSSPSASPSPDLRRDRIPNLFEVLARRTLAPVDLFFFYIFMRDQQRSVDYLDFWLDVAQHMSLCRHYVRELRRSVLIDTPNGDMAASKRSSAVLENLGTLSDRPIRPPMLQSEKENSQDAALSQVMRDEAQNGHSPAASTGSDFRLGSQDRNRPSFQSSPRTQFHTTDSSPENATKRADIRAQAEAILYTYLLPGAEREISFPSAQEIPTMVAAAIEEDGRDDPEVFDAAKDYVFQAMERDAFRRFINAAAFGNMVPMTLAIRVAIGLLILFGTIWGFSVAMMLGAARLTKCWCVLPFFLGNYFASAYLYHLDPVLALAGYSEYEFMKFSKVLEPYIRKIHIRRALMVLAVVSLVTAIESLIVILPKTTRL